MSITSVVLTILLAAGFVRTGLPKALLTPTAVGLAEHHGHSTATFRILGLLELAGSAGLVIGLWWPPLGIAAGLGLAIVCIGGFTSHRRANDPAKALIPAVLFGAIALMILALHLAEL
ncbi:DoxX family protein [Actinocorallia sp. B10E7]|uniref:DoxX family protein n=1 Tax=Actinocorallia sp. B10E7 TaxID=3153558 RepID=UPI00325C6B88